MEPDEQATSLGPCERHPGKPSVATCDECGRPLCLTCAVPVRGRVLGPGCLSRELGPELAPSPPAPAAGRPILLVTGIGFAAAAISTALPWKKFGEGSGPFGAWGLAPRWSILAGVAALLGLLVWATVSLRGRRPGTKWAAALRLLAILVASGAVLHLLRPPPFGPSSVGPWAALISAAVAFAGTLRTQQAAPRHSDPENG